VFPPAFLRVPFLQAWHAVQATFQKGPESKIYKTVVTWDLVHTKIPIEIFSTESYVFKGAESESGIQQNFE